MNRKCHVQRAQRRTTSQETKTYESMPLYVFSLTFLSLLFLGFIYNLMRGCIPLPRHKWLPRAGKPQCPTLITYMLIAHPFGIKIFIAYKKEPFRGNFGTIINSKGMLLIIMSICWKGLENSY